jgi:hypothetical protein
MKSDFCALSQMPGNRTGLLYRCTYAALSLSVFDVSETGAAQTLQIMQNWNEPLHRFGFTAIHSFTDYEKVALVFGL